MAVDHNNPQSRNEEILIATIDGKEYNKLPQSRIEELLLELKEVIEEGGGGGGTNNYNVLTNKPQINGVTLSGDMTAEDLNLVLAEVGKGLSTNDYSNEEKAKVANLLTSIQSILDGSDIDSFGDVEIALLDKADISDLGTAAAKNSTNSVTSGSTDLVESGAVKDAIDSAVASAYHHAGTKTVAQLTHDLLVAANEGNVYNITDSGTTTSDFIEGIGKTIDEGSNVGICKVGNVYMFDLLSGFVDTTSFVQKSQTSGLLKNDGTVNTTIEDDVDSLKSGLTNVDNATILNTQDLTTPSRSKNIWAISIDKLKEDNTSGTWNGNTYSVSGISYVCTVDNGYVNAIENSGNTSGYPSLNVYIGKLKAGNYKISMEDRFRLYEDGVQIYDSYGQADYAFTANGTSTYNVTLYRGTGEIPSNTYHPMVRLATETDSTFAPYIPSVESRIEGLENNITTYTLTAGTNVSIDRGSCVKIGNLVIVDVLFTVSEPIAISTVLIGGLPTIGTSNISIVCYENNYSAFNEKAARIYGYEVFSGESFAAGKYRISTTYTIVN